MARLTSIKLTYTKSRLWLQKKHSRILDALLRHRIKAFAASFALSLIGSVLLAPALQRRLGAYFSNANNLAALKSLLVTVSGSLIGATAIAFSLILFAMQVNVGRMPHGMFKRLSSDRKLLGAFLSSFFIALTVGATSLFPATSQASFAVIIAAWGTALTLVIFILAYRRALALINPSEQLSILVSRVRREIRQWSRRMELARPLLQYGDNREPNRRALDGRALDTEKVAYLRVNSQWDQSARQAVDYCISYAQRFAEVGDHEVSSAAIASMMHINAAYCAFKSGAFPSRNLFVENQDSTDGFINATLEHLRQTMRIALSRGDEQLAENTLRGIAALLVVYLKIDYPGIAPTKIHASLAGGYLQSAVESVAPHDMPDVMMEGVRLMGRSAQTVLLYASPNEVIPLAEKIGLISFVGVARSDHQPVTLTAFEQLTAITFDLFIRGERDMRHPFRRLRSTVTEAAKRFLAVPDMPLMSPHSNNLGPYFSSVSTSSLRSKLTDLTNELIERPTGDVQGSRVIGNIEEWANQIYVEQKELLLTSLERKLAFSFDILHFSTGISELLLALSNAPSCAANDRDSLRRHALWLTSTLSWIPSDAESVSFAENFSVTELLFDAVMTGHKEACEDYRAGASDLLLGWTMKGGRHETGWAILERGTRGLIGLSLFQDDPGIIDAFKQSFAQALAAENSPPVAVRSRAARELRRSLDEHHGGAYALSRIDQLMGQIDRPVLTALTIEIADLLEPPAADAREG